MARLDGISSNFLLAALEVMELELCEVSQLFEPPLEP